MKKLSEIYKQLQLCALACDALSDEEKVVAIKELASRENLERFCEEQAEKKEAEAE